MTSPDNQLALAQQALLAGESEALARFREIVAAEPANVEARYGLASALAAAGEGAVASAALEEARMLQALLLARGAGADLGRLSQDGDYAARVASELYAANHVAAASVVFGRAIAAGHVSEAGLLTYALSLQHQGRAEEAIRVFRAALDLYPSARCHQFLLYPHFLVDDGPRRYAAEARAWAERWAPAGDAPAFANPPGEGRRLRIGYVAPAFGALQVRQFITPVLEAHDPDAVAVFLYPASGEHETAWPDHILVRPIGRLDDDDAAALIRDDLIDVLVDCWGHSAGSRLPVFARRAAPVQAAWINFVQTTGLAQMDYVLHADGSDGRDVGIDPYRERIWKIGPVFNAFRASPDRLPPSPTPALTTGEVTFASFNHPAKISDSALAAWSRVLRAAPGSRFLLKYRYFDDPVLRQTTLARFAAEGVAAERIRFEGHASGEAYHAAFQRVDLMLDAWPANGSTTVLEALSNGVPTLVKGGTSVAGIYLRSLLEACGLPELVAKDESDFAQRAIDLTKDAGRLDLLRASVRRGFDSGPICDELGFTRRLEAALRDMFELWRAESSAANIAPSQNMRAVG